MKNEVARPKVFLDGKQAEEELDKLTVKAKKLREAMMEAATAGDSQKEKRLQQELKHTTNEIRNLKKEAFDVDRVLKNINGASFNELSQAVRKATADLKKMHQTDVGYDSQRQKVVALRTKLDELHNGNKASVPMWSRMANGANKYFNMITLGVASITGVIFSFSQFIKGMVGLDDALADVQKTTGLTRKEVRGMYQDFKLLNTRTPRAELLALAEEAGRLGKTGKKDVMDFVEIANKIKIALGDDLGGNTGEAIREVGKLTEIFKIGEQYGTDFKVSMEKMGSGLNTVANNSNASAEYMIEYMKRMGGISVQSKIAAADVMGYASTFDQLGQNVEMAATAQSKIIVDMFTDPGKYARIAKMEVGEFSKLLKTDANEAFIKFLEGLNGNNEGLSEMAGKLDSLGIDGARATQALASLSSNTKMLREQQVLANEAMEKGTSLQNEYALKNDNLAGSWEKLTAWIHSQFINSNLLSFMETAIGKLAKMTEVVHPLTKAMQEETAQVNLMAIELTNSNTPAERRNEIYKELQRIAPTVVENINAENISISTLRENLDKYNASMIKKLALQDSEESLAEKREAAGKATSARMENELKLEKDMAFLLKVYKNDNVEVAKKLEDILFSDDTTINKYDRMVKFFKGTDFSPKVSKALVTSLNEEKQAADEVATALTAYMERYEKVFGKDKKNSPAPPTTPAGGTPTSNDNFVPDLNSKELKKASKTALESIEEAHNARMSVLQTQYEAEKWNEKRFKDEQLDMELVFLVQKKAILTLNGQSTVDIDKEINNNRLQELENRNAMMLEKDKSLKKQMDESEKEYLKQTEENSQTEEAILKNAIDANTDSIDDSLDKIKDAKDKEKDVLLERARNYEMISNTIVDSLSGIMSGSLDEYERYGDAIVLMALQILKQMAPIWAAQIVGGSLATPDSILTGGIAGIAKFTGMLAIMEGFIGIAEAGVKKGIKKRQEKAEGSMKSGGFGETDPSDDTVKGVYHANEFIGNADSVRNPTVKKVYDIVNLSQKNGTIKRLNLPAVMAAIGMLPAGRRSGGYASNVSGSSQGSPIPVNSPAGGSSIDAETVNELTMALKEFMRWKPAVSVEEYERKRKSWEKVTSGGLR